MGINLINSIENYIKNEIETLIKLNLSEIESVINELLIRLENGNNIYIFGNGGSAATASHFANDFNKGVSEHIEKKFNFVCLNDNVPTIMAIANDIGYDQIFAFQLKGRLKKEDLVIGLSGSGNSPNVLEAIQYAKTQNAVTVGITGYDGGKLKNICDISLHIPVNNMQITEDLHMVMDHLMMTVISEALRG